MTAFFWYTLVCLAFFPKNARFAVPLDLPMRLGAGLFLVQACSRIPWSAAARAAAFRRFFVVERIYDPVAMNLLAAEGFIPRLALAGGESASARLAESLTLYRARRFEESIRMAERALALQPDMADAYNNIGAANCELGRWAEAITALERALALRPDYPLARNNLAWARAESAKGVR